MHAQVPMEKIGPIKIIGDEVNQEFLVPLATYESPLWPSTNRGAKVSRLAGGISATIIKDCMTRSVVVEATNALHAKQVALFVEEYQLEIANVIQTTSRYCKFDSLHCQVLGKLVYVRLAVISGDASGHNMVTSAAESVLNWLLKSDPKLKYISISANFCVDKKVSAVNGILGRGKNVIAEIDISREICSSVLKTTPEKIVELNLKKNLLGSTLAGGIRSANAHFANMLLAIYLATGQDAANIVEGSQGIVHTEISSAGLYFSVTLPNLIVGTVGNGKHLDFARENLQGLDCLDTDKPGKNARKLAIIVAATVLCGELSLLAAQTNPGELMQAHKQFERGTVKQ